MVAQRWQTKVGGFGLAVMGTAASAADLYGLQVTVGTTTTSIGFNRAADAFDALGTTELSRINPSYSGVEAATVAITFRGLPIVASYPTQGSPQLVFSVPSLGIVEAFNGATRDQSEQQLEQYFEQNGNGILDRLTRELVRVSPADPIAGNPNSLMSQMVANDFFAGASPVGDRKEEGSSGSSNLIGVGARIGSFSQAGLRSNTVTIPLSYTLRADLDPRRQVGLSMPLSYTKVEGAKAFSVAPGLSYRHPINDDWSISPALGLGITGSSDLASAGAIASGSLSSRYIFTLAGLDFTLGNMVGHYRTLKFSAGDYSTNPGVANTVAKNGLAVAKPVDWLDGGASVELSYANTHFWGTELYTMNYHEFGLSLGTHRSARSARSFFKAGITYLYTGKSRGTAFNLGYWF